LNILFKSSWQTKTLILLTKMEKCYYFYFFGGVVECRVSLNIVKFLFLFPLSQEQ